MRKQLLYLTNAQITAYIWQSGSMSAGHTFYNNAAGCEGFSEHIGEHPNIPTYLLTDLIEEDFQRENIPHVASKARQNLIQRRLTNLYRDTPYRQATLQGREKDGRKDDRMLLSALTNAELPKPWLTAILQRKLPLVGIYSVALLSPLLFKKMDLGKGPVLLVTHQSSGLRTNYFHEGQLRFSRLTLLANDNPQSIAEIAELEIAKTRQFLASTRLMARGELVSVVVLANSEILQHLQKLSPDTADIAHRFIDIADASTMLGLKNLHDISVFDPLVLSLLAQSPPPNQYKVFEHTRFYLIWQSRIVLNILRVVALIGGLLWAGVNVLAAIDATAQARQLERENLISLQHYQDIHKSMPPTLANPHDMKSAVDLEQMISQNSATPDAMLGTISAALSKLDNIKITQLEWQVSATDTSVEDASVESIQPVAGEEIPLAATLIGVPTKPFETVIIEGEIIPFKNDYRAAHDALDTFLASLNKNPQLHAKITRAPLDLRPAVRLDGQTGNSDAVAKARFSVKLSWKP